MRYFFILLGFIVALSSCSSTKSASRSNGVRNSGTLSQGVTNKTSENILKNKEEKLPEMPGRPAAPKIVIVAPFNIENGDILQFKYAIKMDVEVERLANAELYRFIESWWGTPYRMGGSTLKGIDCSAFTQTLLSVVYGQTVPRTAHEQKLYCVAVDLSDLKEGDLLFFNTRRGQAITHVGIYLQQDQFVHASSSNGVTISSLQDSYWSKKFKGAGRVVEEKIVATGSR
ncbi:MAG: NlpC/P60 family protein [Agriterribacter sp.]